MSDGYVYRVRQVGVSKTWARFSTTTELKPGAALDELMARVKQHGLPTAFDYQMEVHHPRKGWVVVATQAP